MPHGLEGSRICLTPKISPMISESQDAMQPTLPLEPEMIFIPAGEFLMGSDPAKDKQAFKNEQPQHTLSLPDYYLAKTPVTNVQYAAFLQATDHELPEHWTDGNPPQGKEGHPVIEVTWHDAIAYCRWLSEATGKSYGLPSEAEWEKGARDTDGRFYPWSNRWDKRRCNSRERGQGGTTPVDAYPDGASPYGILDMAGNVWEWTRSLWGKNPDEPDFAYPYDPNDGRENLEAPDDTARVLRGGSFLDYQWLVRCAYRGVDFPQDLYDYLGFRVVLLS